LFQVDEHLGSRVHSFILFIRLVHKNSIIVSLIILDKVGFVGGDKGELEENRFKKSPGDHGTILGHDGRAILVEVFLGVLRQQLPDISSVVEL